MGRRLAVSKATRGVSKVKDRVQSSSSNPKTKKFRSQRKSLAVITKGAPTKKLKKDGSAKRAAREAKQILDNLESVDMIEHDGTDTPASSKKGSKHKNGVSHEGDKGSLISTGTQRTTASFASVWSQCTLSSMEEFFQVWNPNLETHKNALSVVAGLSQIMSESGTEQSELEFTNKLFKLLSSDETPMGVLTGALLALTFVMRKLSSEVIVKNFDQFYPILKNLMEKHHNCKRKTLMKCLLRCFSTIAKAHPMGKEAIDSSLRKKINIAIRKYKVQNKIQL